MIRHHPAKIGSCWRKLNPGRQALLVLVHLCKGETFADLATGFAVDTATAWRYARETITRLVGRAPPSFAARWPRRRRSGTHSW